MLTNEMDAETDKWNNADENNDIVKRAKNMSAMAFSMYQFTKGEGTLKTTQDLFTQAEYFAEEANRLYKVVRQFSYQVINQENVHGKRNYKIKYKMIFRFLRDNLKRSFQNMWIKFLLWCRLFNFRSKSPPWERRPHLSKWTMSFRRQRIL